MFQLGKEVGVGLVSRIDHPLDFLGSGDTTHPIPLGARAHVNELGAGGQIPHLVRFFRRQCAGVGQAEFAGAGPGIVQEFGQLSHGGGNMVVTELKYKPRCEPHQGDGSVRVVATSRARRWCIRPCFMHWFGANVSVLGGKCPVAQ